MPQCLPEEEESNRLDKIQEKVKNIIDQADQDGDGKIRYTNMNIYMCLYRFVSHKCCILHGM